MQLGSPAAEIFLAVTAYLVGGIPFGWLVARIFKGVDLRTVGSGSVGATNASRLWQGAASIGMFIFVFALDFGKGLIVALFSVNLAEEVGLRLGAVSDGLTLQVICGTAAILGHIFTPYLRFKGGKGVATTFGVVTALAPLSSLVGLGAWGLVLGITRYMSLGSIGAMFVIPVSYLVEYIPGAEDDSFRGRLVVFAFLALIAVFVIWSHRANITRILQGRERKVGDLDQQL